MPVDLHEVHRIVEEEIEGRIADRRCPKCKATTTMVKAYYTPEEEFLPELKLIRCMKCLTLFSIELVDQG